MFMQTWFLAHIVILVTTDGAGFSVQPLSGLDFMDGSVEPAGLFH